MTHCPYCSLSLPHSGGEVFCSRTMDDFSRLENGIFSIGGRDIHSGAHQSRFAIRFVHGGRMTFRIDGETHRIDSGGVVLFREHSTYTFDSGREESAHTGIAFRPSFVRSAAATAGLDALRLLDRPGDDVSAAFPAHTRWPHSRQAKILGDKLWRYTQQNGDPMALEALAFETMEWFLSENALYRNLEPKFLATRRQNVRLELARRLGIARESIEYGEAGNLSVSRIASQSCLSEFHFIRLYREAFGITPHQHIIRKRMQQARRMLLTTDLTIATVATLCGYADHSAFSRAFRTAFGQAPGLVRPNG